jgi:DNA-binding transcriptional regulator YiaG
MSFLRLEDIVCPLHGVTQWVSSVYTMARRIDSQGGNALKQIRDFLDLSQDGFAALLGTTKNTVARRERGEGEPMLTLSQWLRLQRALDARGRSIEEFLPEGLPES